jgi:hypothetical protein
MDEWNSCFARVVNLWVSCILSDPLAICILTAYTTRLVALTIRYGDQMRAAYDIGYTTVPDRDEYEGVMTTNSGPLGVRGSE